MPLATTRSEPLLLTASLREKVWGSRKLSPWFPDVEPGAAAGIGEVWYQAPVPLPILVKLIFTSEALSVQVHPGDDYARRYENSPGKTEMWHILRADPGARIAIGLREALTTDRLCDAARSGEIEHLLNWVEVSAGQTFQIPAGTIHAIGAGLVLCEIQQQSDVTYRLYDYGRPRELHLDRALAVSNLAPWSPEPPPPGYLARCQYYAAQALDLSGPLTYVPDEDRFHLLIVTSGAGQFGARAFHQGQVWHVPAGAGAFRIEPDGPLRILRAYVP